MLQKKIATLDDVAKHAGVSTATVSRCLNSPSQLSQKTRDKVLASIEELQYAPNFGGQALAAQRTNTIGAVIPTIENAIFARGIQAFQEKLNEHNITLLLSGSNYSPDRELKQIKTLISRGAEGILMIGFERPNDVYDFLEARNIPYVIAWQYHENTKKLCVGFNNFQASYELTSKVIEYGHKNIGFLAGVTAGNDRAELRYQGAKQCMIDQLGSYYLPVIESKYSIDSAREGFRKLIQQHPNLSAILCGNDVLAAGAILEAREQKIRVPEDISITGFDDIDIAQLMTPSLTTVHVPHRQMGIKAAELFINKRQNPAEVATSIYLATNIIERESLIKI